MIEAAEYRRDNFLISTDHARLDLDEFTIFLRIVIGRKAFQGKSLAALSSMRCVLGFTMRTARKSVSHA
jgi:hypothetical protein